MIPKMKLQKMMKMLHPIKVDLEDNFINFRYIGSDNIIYKTKKNLFEENTGLTILNPDIDIPAYLLELSYFGTKIICGHIIDNTIAKLKAEGLENILLIVDFTDVTEVSENFMEQYIKFYLSTKSKVISINQNTNINYAFSKYIESITDIQEVV